MVLGGEREGVLIDGFDLGNSPAEYEVPQGSTLVLTTTNGTRAILHAADEAEIVLVGALTCLEAVARAVARLVGDGDVAIRCAGVRGEIALDDVYVAGRLVERIDELAGPAFLTDGARSARAISRDLRRPARGAGRLAERPRPRRHGPRARRRALRARERARHRAARQRHLRGPCRDRHLTDRFPARKRVTRSSVGRDAPARIPCAFRDTSPSARRTTSARFVPEV